MSRRNFAHFVCDEVFEETFSNFQWAMTNQPYQDFKTRPPWPGSSLPIPLPYWLHFKYVLVNVDPARVLVLVLARACRNGTQRGALENGQFEVAGEEVVAKKPTLGLDAIVGGNSTSQPCARLERCPR